MFYVGNEIVYLYGRTFKHSEYDKLKKVVSMFISFDAPTVEEENSMTILQLSKNMKIGYNSLKENDYDKIRIIIIYLGQEDSDNPLLEFLKLIFRSDIPFEEKIKQLKNEHQIQISETFVKEVHEMCGLGDLVEKRGIAIGIKQGIEQGKFETTLNHIKKIMKNFNVDELSAIQTLEIDEKDFPIYLNALKETL